MEEFKVQHHLVHLALETDGNLYIEKRGKLVSEGLVVLDHPKVNHVEAKSLHAVDTSAITQKSVPIFWHTQVTEFEDFKRRLEEDILAEQGGLSVACLLLTARHDPISCEDFLRLANRFPMIRIESPVQKPSVKEFAVGALKYKEDKSSSSHSRAMRLDRVPYISDFVCWCAHSLLIPSVPRVLREASILHLRWDDKPLTLYKLLQWPSLRSLRLEFEQTPSPTQLLIVCVLAPMGQAEEVLFFCPTTTQVDMKQVSSALYSEHLNDSQRRRLINHPEELSSSSGTPLNLVVEGDKYSLQGGKRVMEFVVSASKNKPEMASS